jgi:hypothetical protein
MSDSSKGAKRGKKQINKDNSDACGNSSDGSSDCEVPANAPRKILKARRPSATLAAAAAAKASPGPKIQKKATGTPVAKSEGAPKKK